MECPKTIENRYFRRGAVFLIYALSIFAFSIGVNAQTNDESSADNGVHVINIVTDDNQGNSLVKSTGYVAANIEVDSTLSERGQIKVRGNSTAGAEKKPYTIKFDKKQDVFGMGKAKKWVLLANCYDPTLLRNYLAFSMAKTLRLNYTSEVEFVDLYLDGVYKGNYLLTEAVEVGTNRIDIDVDKGDFLIEYESSRVEEDVTYIRTPVYNYRFILHEPEECTDKQYADVLNALDEIETAMDSGDFKEVVKEIDIDSFVDFYILNEYLKTLDVGYSSVYFYYQDGKLYAGPAWDYDLSTGNASATYYKSYNNVSTSGNSYEGTWATGQWFGKLLKYTEFYQLVKYRYHSLQNEIIQLYEQGGFLDAAYEKYQKSFLSNFSDAGWNVDKVYAVNMRIPDDTYDANLQYLKNWLQERNAWLINYWDAASETLDYSEYYHAVAKTKGYNALCYSNYDNLENALDVDVYADGITQTDIDNATAAINDAVDAMSLTLSNTVGVPYDTQNGVYQYNSAVSHVVINQIYGAGAANKKGKRSGYVSNDFIELYNPTDTDIDLSTWALYYRSSAEGSTASDTSEDGDSASDDTWSQHNLTGTIKAHSSYLVACAAIDKSDDDTKTLLQITGDESWSQEIYNKGCCVLLMASRNGIAAAETIYDNDAHTPAIANYVDMLAVSGNDAEADQTAPCYETSASYVQSKKKTIRRREFTDTDDNSTDGDFEVVDYSFDNKDYINWIKPRNASSGAWDSTTNAEPAYSVAYECNGGSAIAAQEYEYTTCIEEPEAPVKEGYVFAGWYTDKSLRTAYDFDEKPVSNVVLYAKWEKGTYTIQFESNGGSEVASIQAEYEALISEPDAPVRQHYDFAGWFLDEELTQAFSFDTMPGRDVTLYAGWKGSVYTITYDSGGGSAVAKTSYRYESAIQEPETPTRSGYQFTGWYTDAALSERFAFTTMPAADITLYAGWEVKQYTVTYETNGGSAVAAVTYDYGAVVAEPEIPEREGYTFDGWYSDETLNTKYPFTTMPAADITLYAAWQKKQYKVVYIDTDGTIVKTESVLHGDSATAPDGPEHEGYTFLGWTTTADSVTGDTFIVATYKKLEDADGSGGEGNGTENEENSGGAESETGNEAGFGGAESGSGNEAGFGGAESGIGNEASFSGAESGSGDEAGFSGAESITGAGAATNSGGTTTAAAANETVGADNTRTQVRLSLNATYKKPGKNKKRKTVKKKSVKKITLYTAKHLKKAQLKAVVSGSKHTVNYYSSNLKVVKVSQKGKITALKKGTAYITAEVDGVIYRCKVVVKKYKATVSI